MNKSAGSSPAQAHGRIAAALLALCLLGATPSMAATRSHHALPKLSATNVKILALIKRFVASPPVDHTVVEKIIGEKLNIERGNDGVYFNEYVLYPVNIGPDVSIDIRYSEIVPGGGALTGTQLRMDIEGESLSFEDVARRFPHLYLSEFPIHPVPAATTSYSVKEAWGELTFSFREDSPDRVERVLFTLPLQAAAPKGKK